MINLIFIIDNNWNLQKYDNIEEFKYEDFELEGYRSHGVLKGIVSV